MTRLPKVTFRAMSFEENMDMMAMFINDEQNQEQKSNTEFFKNKYAEITNIDFDNMNREQIGYILKSKLLNSWSVDAKDIEQKVIDFRNNWNLINDSVMQDLSRRLNIDWPDDAFDIQARVGIMYSSPRYISHRMFDTNINTNNDRMRENAIHEICHFLYFEKWKEMFNDYDARHYNRPHIAWYLSEAIIDPLLNNEVFRRYTNIEIPSYKVFYDMIIEGKSVIDTLRRIVSQEPIEQSIKDCYSFFLDNEEIIRNGYTNRQSSKKITIINCLI